MDARMVLTINFVVAATAAMVFTTGAAGWSAVFGGVALVCAAVVLTAYALSHFRNGGAR